MKVLVVGGSKSGKSAFAQTLAVKLSGNGKRYYVATMIPADGEDRERIRRHVADRAGLGFETLEQGRNLPQCLARADCRGAFLLDSVTALLMNEMYPDPVTWKMDPGAGIRTAESLSEFAKSIQNGVFVADDLSGDPKIYDPETESFRQMLAQCQRTLAALCDTVVEVSGGNAVIWKGEWKV